MTTAPEEFSPYEQTSRILQFWWVLVLCAILGGALGWVAHRFKPPVYEAQAIISASIDLNKVDFLRITPDPEKQHLFTQDDEDLALMLVETSLIQVEPRVLAFAQANGWDISSETLHANSTIERKHAYWQVRYRSADPVQAQKLVNTWTEAGFADLQAKQKAGQVPSYVLLDLAQLAELPQNPQYFQRNVFVLAGAVIGWVVGLFLIHLPFAKIFKPR